MGKKDFFRKHGNKIWAPLEFIALACALSAPVFFSSGTAMKGGAFSRAFLSMSFMNFEFSPEQDRRIASSVLFLEAPNPEYSLGVIEKTVSDRQIRLESADAKWRLVELELKSGQDWTSIELLYDKDLGSSYSSYIELFEGENEFRVRYENTDGDSYEYPLLILQKEID